jgi:hypothetical protein
VQGETLQQLARHHGCSGNWIFPTGSRSTEHLFTSEINLCESFSPVT